MSLESSEYLFIDCQTTGFTPGSGAILEIAWAWMRFGQQQSPEITSRLIQLPAGLRISAKVSEVTGITEIDLAEAVSKEQAANDFLASFAGRTEKVPAVIHYAQFEKSFLQDFLSPVSPVWPFEVICSYQVAQRLFPHLPSRNIRGLAGYFGEPLPEIKRASAHVRATIQIWQGLVPQLELQEIKDIPALHRWLKTAAKPKSTRYEYRIDKEKRLGLPDQPGVYRMLSQSGRVLYVGKATSLHDRVNSYFRGRKGRDPRKLEMLAQTWDLRVTTCASALEAALLENDEIKKWDPPYNVSLKARQRQMLFYSRDFERRSVTGGAEFPRGPFRFFSSIEQVRWLQQSLFSGQFRQIFFNEIPVGDLAAGFGVFCQRRGQAPETWTHLRHCLAWGLWQLRKQSRQAEVDLLEEVELEVDSANEAIAERPLSLDEIADKFERLFTRAAAEDRRAKLLTLLLDAKVCWKVEGKWHELSFSRGQIVPTFVPLASPILANAWENLQIADYDRMSVLLSELSRFESSIEPASRVSALRPTPKHIITSSFPESR